MLALGYELSVEADRAVRAARRLPASEQALLESEKRLELVVSAADLAAWDWDVKRDEVWVAPKGRALLGFQQDERISGARFLENVHPEDRSAVTTGVKRILSEGGTYAREYRRVLPDGRTRWFAGRSSAELDATGEAVRVRGISVDVTARVEDAESLAAQKRELAVLSRMAMHGELSGSLAHELNQPLTSILSNAQAAQRIMTKDPIDAASIREILEDIVSANQHAADVIRRVRALVKNDGEVRLPVDVNEIARDTLRLMQSDLLAQGVEVETQFAEALPPVLGDHVQIQQVLLNLVVNACDAMSAREPGSRRIVIRTEALKGSTIGVSVEDSGSGIPPELVGKVFEAFRTTKTKGLGLGLSVCRTIITAHGGALWATNNLERGSTFRFTMPTGDTHP
jgi:PAS domain S-box-containing protein